MTRNANTQHWRLREETVDDQRSIHELTRLAFADRPYADGDEQEVINRLRSRGELTLSLVAEQDDEVIGQVTFSPARADDGSGPWFALGPVAVHPERQGRGVGHSLIQAGLERLRDFGALGCMLTGNPTYYARFGFTGAPEQTPPQEPSEFFMVLFMTDYRPTGPMYFSPAFYEEIPP